MDSSICGTQSETKCPARRNLKNYVYFVARNTSPKAESALPRLNQWLNRTLRSIVPKTPGIALQIEMIVGCQDIRRSREAVLH
jgi:hypothetical protein